MEITKLYKGGLVLEGGGMRGSYTAGVLDFFIDKDLYLKSFYNKETNELIVKGGWTHPLFGEITDDIAFNVNLSTMELTTVNETINLGG